MAMAHHCHAIGCRVVTPPKLLMCPHHWRMVPPNLQRQVWRTYREGQCDDKRPSVAWLDAAAHAIKAVHEQEQAKPQLKLF